MHMQQAANTPAKPVVFKRYGVVECIGHSTCEHLAAHTYALANPEMARQAVRVVERRLRVDGAEREVYLVERAA